jgi:hypothetical protein
MTVADLLLQIAPNASGRQKIEMTVADDILDEVRRKSGLTELELSVLLFGRQQRVNSSCRRLVAERRLVRDGKGGAAAPLPTAFHQSSVRI